MSSTPPLIRESPTLPRTSRGGLLSRGSLLRRLLRNRSGSVGLAIILVYLLIGLLGALKLTPYPSAQNHVRDRLQAPSAEYILGTDLLGRDLASRIMEGAGNSLRVALLSVALAGTVGTLLGTVSGYVGGRVDNVIMRIMDVFFALPALLMALVIVTVLGAGLNTTVLAIAIVSVPAYARLARASVLSIKEMEYITANRALGAPGWRILFRHILPNAMTPLIVQGTLGIGTAILDAAALSFLGLGAQPPLPEWGAMLSEARNDVFTSPHLVFFPGIAIMLAVLGFNLLGDGMRDALDPRLNRI